MLLNKNLANGGGIFIYAKLVYYSYMQTPRLEKLGNQNEAERVKKERIEAISVELKNASEYLETLKKKQNILDTEKITLESRPLIADSTPRNPADIPQKDRRALGQLKENGQEREKNFEKIGDTEELVKRLERQLEFLRSA